MWYIMDEFGSRVRQSHDPTVSMVAFFFIPTQLAFSLMWPTKDLDYAGKINFNGGIYYNYNNYIITRETFILHEY